MTDITLDDRAILVRAAIARIKATDQHYRDVESNPVASGIDRRKADDQKHASEMEFRFQWRNVEMLLDERDAKR